MKQMHLWARFRVCTYVTLLRIPQRMALALSVSLLATSTLAAQSATHTVSSVAPGVSYAIPALSKSSIDSLVPELSVSQLPQEPVQQPQKVVVAEVSSSLDNELPNDPAFEEDQRENDPHAANAGQKGHTETGEPQQTKRVLGIMPNFSSVSADVKLPPLSPKKKFLLAGRNSFDYSSFIIAGIQSGISFAGDSYPEFHEGAVGFGRYYWHTLADTADENFMVGGLFPMIFKQDPRFYTLGHGGFPKRAAYAISRIIISRSDEGNQMPNFSEIIGAGAAAGVSSLYYPGVYRTWTKVGQKWLTSSLIDAANNLFKEYWPDINHKLFHTHD